MIMIRILIFLTMFLFLINTEANVIHTVYFQPADQPAPTKDDIRDTKGIMLKAQSYFLREMKRHGLAPKTFRLERDGAGMMVIHIVKGKHDLKAYSDVNLINEELPPEISDGFRRKNKIRVVFLAGAREINGVGGLAWKSCLVFFCGHTAIIPESDRVFILSTTIHEMGHAFGLLHNAKKPPAEKFFIMAATIQINGNKGLNIKDYLLDADEAQLLNDHSFFNPGPLNVTPRMLAIKTWGALKSQYR